MYLRSLTLKGFKSFPDRTRLEFGPGVSVVVGPNGSGKSNITDAVLWALGEQSPVAVRGQTMQDVIFAGAPGRQASKGAEVELVLDDGDGTLALEAPEVSILRRLERSGEGEYRLAGARCRLVDVLEVLSDTGLGKEMHSVISQGRVEAIVTSKPRDRRLLIEEAAGLGKHRKRRRRAQLKLERTQENLDRALDVEREARSRLRPLKRQAEAAETHARLERQMLEVRWELAREELRSQQLALDEARQAAAQARERRGRVERELREVGERRQAAEEALAERSAQREELSRRCFVAQAALDRVSYRIEATRSQANAVAARRARSGELLTALRAESEADIADPQATARIAELESAVAALERDREAELARELAELEQQLLGAGQETERRTATMQEAQQARQAAEDRFEQARTTLRHCEREVETTRREAARVGAELAAVNQFLRSHASSSGGAPALADRLDVDPGYELALAAALDGRLAAAIVPDRATGGGLLDDCGPDGGRALIVDAPRAGSARDGQPPAAGGERLADHLRGEGEALELARALLSQAWVVDSLEGLERSFAGVAVTRSGRVWSAASGELMQAAALGEERVLEERNRREELLRASEAALQAEHRARASAERAAEELSRQDAERERIIAAHRSAVRARDEASEEQRRIAAQIERRRAAPDEGPGASRLAQLSAELSSERAALERAQRARAERGARIERLEAGITADQALAAAIGALLEALSGAVDAIAQRRGAFEAALSADREVGEHVAAELRSCAQREATLHADLHRGNEALTGTEVRLQRTGDKAAEVAHELGQLARRLELPGDPASEARSAEETEALQGRLERLLRRREQLGPVNPLAEEEYGQALAHVEELEHQRKDLEVALRELQKLISDTDRQIRETFEQTFAAAARNFEEVVAQLFPDGSGQLRLVAERERPAQVLGGSTLANALEASGEGGGGASELDDPDEEPGEDLLGVEIELTPAGKEMQRLSLLSGGEKSMTALAFLFAVFLARPCPFYILDEVEAALDDLNIDRFLLMLRRYAERAQFIVVTHQRRTMEAADSLYGVSMGSDGISKVISRRLPPAEAAA